MERAAAPQAGGGTDDRGHRNAYKILAGAAGAWTGCSASSRTRARGRHTMLAIARAKANKSRWLLRLQESREQLACAGPPRSPRLG